MKASIKATCAALSKTSTYFEPFPSLWGDFFLIYFRKIVSKENEMHIVRINVHDEIKSIRIWPTASKAYVYGKKENKKC